MRRSETSAFNHWWFGRSTEPAPGIVVPFFGAGVSMDQPAGLPGAVELTEALMRHLLDARAADELLGVFERHQSVLGRKVPRLEALLSRAIGVDPDAVNLLNLFENIEPNRNHFIIADHLIRTHGWGITTNFEDGPERASGYSIPVHVLDPECGQIRVLYGDSDADWGLIKLHGTIGLGARALAATIEQLTPGLHDDLRKLMDRALEAADLVVVAGYSGSDHFDINAFLRLKMNDKYGARLIWIDHQPEERIPAEAPKTLGFQTFESAFGGVRVSAGPTSELLSAALGQAAMPELQRGCFSWREKMLACYQVPSEVVRHRIGAAMAAQMGFGTLARECIAQARHELDDDEACLLDEVRACRVEGFWESAYALLRFHERTDVSLRAQAAAVLREAALPLRALTLYIRSPSLAKTAFGNAVFAAILLDIYRSMLRWPRLIRAPFVALLNWWVKRRLCDVTARQGSQETSSLKSDYQLLRVRRSVYSGLYETGDLWRFIHEEVSYPNFLTDRGALVPGYYLLCASTAAELDLLPELLDVRLQFADLLILQIQMEHGAAIKGKLDENSRTFVEVACAVIKEQLIMARDIAQMLGEEHAVTRVARAWIEFDRAFEGLHRWKRQRLYLPARCRK